MSKTDKYIKKQVKRAKSEIEASMTDEFMRELERLFLISRQVLSGKMRAERRTKKTGSGLEFAEHREYVPGDDFRTIDWNLYGRLERLYVRLFEEEEDLPIYILFDVSSSMLEGTPSKILYAFKLASALTYVSLAHLDRAVMIPFVESLKTLPPPSRGKGQMFKMFHSVKKSTFGGKTNLEQTARSFVYRRPRRGQVIVISDFMNTSGYEEAINLLRYHKYRVITLQVLSPEEINPKLQGDVELLDVETGKLKSITVTSSLLKAYKEELSKFTLNLKSFCQDRNIPYFLTVTNEKIEKIMLEVFRKGGFLK